jgi:adenine deaminase
VVFDDLEKFQVRQTYKKGRLVAEKGKYLLPTPPPVSQPRSTMNLRYNAPTDLQVRPKATDGKKIRIIEIVPNQIVTREVIVDATLNDGQIVSNVSSDILKLVVVERHRATGNVGVGFVRGFKLKRGAIGSTVAHDAHNVVVAGTNDSDIVMAIAELEQLRGGQVAVADGKVMAALPLPIAGLVSDRPLEEVVRGVAALNAAAQAMGCPLEAPFMTLSFLSLSPIPELKLTDQGLIDAVHMRTTSLVV